MKKTAALFFLIFIIGLITPILATAGGGKFEGVIHYTISIPNSTLPEEQIAMFPKASTLSIKGTNTCNESSSAMGNVVEITNYEKKFTVTLLDMMGKKIAIKKTLDEITKDNGKGPKPTVQVTNETKEIAGYKCKKAIITLEKNGNKSSLEAWYTNELGGKESNFGNPVYSDIDGILMEFTLQERSITMKYSVSKVEKKAIADSAFEIPADYKLMTQEELKSMFGGGM